MRETTKYAIIDSLITAPEGLTTYELSKKLGLSRSVTSLYLNELAKEQWVIKKDVYPVRWLMVERQAPPKDVFDQFIGSQGSAKKAIDLCKSAISYPPQGLPILINGNSGVGKTFLAHLIFDYLHQQNARCSERLIVFNCADYANNPELLSSILFGHKKGAFTGAQTSKKGLLAQANNGLLFLDEVHRLSVENQEKLFQFMDSGNFRLIGEEDRAETAAVRLIFATTETPQNVLLPTFFRRISTVVELPDYHRRPLLEREILLKSLFQKESRLLAKKLSVSKELFEQLLAVKDNGNIGYLVNKIKMYCAHALQTQKDASTLFIGTKQQPQVLITQTSKLLDYEFEEKTACQQLLAKIRPISEVKELKTMLVDFAVAHLPQLPEPELDVVFTKIEQQMIAKTTAIMGNTRIIEPYRHLFRFYLRSKHLWHQTLMQRFHEQLHHRYPRTFLLAKKITCEVDAEYRPAAHFLAAVLLIDTVSEEIAYHTLLVAHGNTTASSIQAVANQMCGDYLFDAIDMPLDSSLKDIVLKVKHWLAERDTAKGVIMLVDMGSLTHLYKSLKPEILGELLVVNNLTTSFALEIGQQLLNHSTFTEITKTIEAKFVTDIQYFEGFSNDRNIIISSILGYDIAQKLKEIFERLVNPEIKIIVMNFSELLDLLDREKNEKGYLNTTELVLTTSYLDNQTNVRSVNLLDLLDEDFEKEKLSYVFRKVVNEKKLPEMINECVLFFSKKGLSEKLTFLNPEIILKQVEKIIENCERRFGIQFNVKIRFNLTMHLALMIERMLLGSADYPVPVPLAELKINNIYFYSNIKDLLYTVATFYNITISDWEMYILYEIMSEQRGKPTQAKQNEATQ